MDGDGSHDPADVPRLLDALADAYLAIGSRYVPRCRIVNWASLRRALSLGGNLYARACLGLATRDVTSGFRAYRRALLEAIDLGSLRSDGYAFQIEMVRRAAAARATVVEIPITFVDRVDGRSKLSRAIVLEAIVRVAWWGVCARAGALRRLGRRRD